MKLSHSVVAFLGAIGMVECLNFTGFCYPQGRYLSDQELIDIAIKSRLQYQGAENPEANKIYRSAEDFRSQNPGCCAVDRSRQAVPDATLSRILGFYVSVAV